MGNTDFDKNQNPQGGQKQSGTGSQKQSPGQGGEKQSGGRPDHGGSPGTQHSSNR